MAFLILCLVFLSPLLVTVIYNVVRDIFKAFNYGFKHHKQPFLLKQYTNKNRFIVLKEQYQYLYDMKDVFYLSKDFLNYFKRLEDFSKTDYVSETFMYSEEHRTFDNIVSIFERIERLYKEKSLFSINVTQLLSETELCIIYTERSPKERIKKFLKMHEKSHVKLYKNEILQLVNDNKDLTLCNSLVFVEYVDYLVLLNTSHSHDNVYKFIFKKAQRDFENKFKEVYDHYNIRVLNNLNNYHNRKIQIELLNKIEYLIDNLPKTELEKRVRLLSISKEINNIDLNTSQELFDKIQKELIIILESYSKFLEKEVNKDSIEVQAFYRYLKTVSKDSL